MIFDKKKEDFLESLFVELQVENVNYGITEMSVSGNEAKISFTFGENTFEFKMTEGK